MYKTFYAILTLIWIGDILDFSILDFLDKEIPLNFWAWLLVWIFLPNTRVVTKIEKDS